MRRFSSLQTLRAELTLCANRRHSPHFRMAMSAAVRSTSTFGWKGGPQIYTILLGNRRPEIGGDDLGYSRLSPKTDVHRSVGKARRPDPPMAQYCAGEWPIYCSGIDNEARAIVGRGTRKSEMRSISRRGVMRFPRASGSSLEEVALMGDRPSLVLAGPGWRHHLEL
jgi:hypothetical protein